MSEEFCLEDKMFICNSSFKFDFEKKKVYLEEDVKEFIKRLKEEIPKHTYGEIDTIQLLEKLNKLAGEKLIWI